MGKLAAVGRRWWAGFVLLVVSGLTLGFAFKLLEFTFRWLINDNGAALGIAPLTTVGLKVLTAAVLLPLILAVFSCDLSSAVVQIVLFWMRGVKLGAVYLLLILPLAALQLVFYIAPQFGFIDVEAQIGARVQFLVWLLTPFWTVAVLKRLPQSALNQGLFAELSRRFSPPSRNDGSLSPGMTHMTSPKFDQDFWEQLWSKTLREQADKVAHRPPNAHLMAEMADLPPGRALDAGCGHGADTLWLAAQGWQVKAVDFSVAALAQGRSMAEAAGAEIAERIDWIEGDLATWTAEPGHYDLVVCLYVHVASSVEDMVRRMANGVAPGGTLFLVGHRPIDPGTGAATAAANQVQVSIEGAVAALDPSIWELVVTEERPRAAAGTGVDAVIRARRRI